MKKLLLQKHLDKQRQDTWKNPEKYKNEAGNKPLVSVNGKIKIEPVDVKQEVDDSQLNDYQGDQFNKIVNKFGETSLVLEPGIEGSKIAELEIDQNGCFPIVLVKNESSDSGSTEVNPDADVEMPLIEFQTNGDLQIDGGLDALEIGNLMEPIIFVNQDVGLQETHILPSSSQADFTQNAVVDQEMDILLETNNKTDVDDIGTEIPIQVIFEPALNSLLECQTKVIALEKTVKTLEAENLELSEKVKRLVKHIEESTKILDDMSFRNSAAILDIRKPTK